MKKIYSILSATVLCLSLAAPVATAAETKTVSATLRSPWIFVDGVEMGFLDSRRGMREAITYQGTVYIPLATAGLWMGADTAWDERTVTITANGAAGVYHSLKDFNTMDVERLEGVEQYQADMVNGVEVQLCPDMVVMVNDEPQTFANAVGEPVYPVLFREEVYLPVRSIAELLGKQVVWLPSDGGVSMVHLYDAPSREELEEAGAYLAAVRSRLDAIRTLLAETPAVRTDEEFTANMRTIQTDLMAILDLSAPAFRGFGWYVYALRNGTSVLLSDRVDPYLPEEESSGAAEARGMPPVRVPSTFWRFSPEAKWESIKDSYIPVVDDVTTYFLNLERAYDRGQEFLAAVGG